jgi:hypothetical protein
MSSDAQTLSIKPFVCVLGYGGDSPPQTIFSKLKKFSHSYQNPRGTEMQNKVNRRILFNIKSSKPLWHMAPTHFEN